MDTKMKVEILEKTLNEILGDVLDRVRITEISDRAMEQIERNIKKKVNAATRFLKEELFEIKSEQIK